MSLFGPPPERFNNPIQWSKRRRYSYCIFYKSLKSREALDRTSFCINPRPVHGASNKILSNPPFLMPNVSVFVTITFQHPIRAKLAYNALILVGFVSFAIRTPWFFIKEQICEVFPPGAAAASKMTSPGSGLSAMTGKREAASWSI